VFLSGCVNLEEYIQINRNGSAKIVMSYSIPIEGLTLLKDCEAVLNDLNGRKSSDDLPRIFDSEKLRAHFKKYKGVDIISARVTREDGRVKTYFNLYVEDFRKVLRNGMLPYTSLEKDGKDYVFAARYPFNLAKLNEKPSLKKILSEFKVNFKVKTPTAITKTNAPKKLANMVEWNFGEKAPFTKSDGRFSVHFKADGLTFLEDREKE
jgi:hypothetical protein